MLKCEVIEETIIPMGWRDMITGEENIFSIRSLEVLLQMDKEGMIECIRFTKITNTLGIEICNRNKTLSRFYFFNRDRLVDPVVWVIEEPKEFLEEVFADVQRNESLTADLPT